MAISHSPFTNGYAPVANGNHYNHPPYTPYVYLPIAPQLVPPMQPGVIPKWLASGDPFCLGSCTSPCINIYFSCKTDVYGGFRLNSDHVVNWAGVDAPTAEHWFESGRFESVGTGLGAEGMGNGGTFPSNLGLRVNCDHKTNRFSRLLGIGGNGGLREARLEYGKSRTEESEYIRRLKTGRDVLIAVVSGQLDGARRQDWEQVWRAKLEKILYLKFQQHPNLLNLLLDTGTSRIIFNYKNSMLEDGGNLNGNSSNGENELGQALIHVRYTLSQQLTQEEEE